MLLLLVEELEVGERADEEVVGGCGRSRAAGVSRVWNPWTRASLSSDVGARKVAMIVYIYMIVW